MPYRKSYNRKGRKKGYRRRKPNTTVRTIARVEAKKAVKSLVETKQVFLTGSAAALDWNTGTVVGFGELVSAGTGDDQRIGEWITPKGLYIRGNLTLGDTTNMVRIIVIQYKTSGSGPVVNTVLHSVANVRAPLSPFADAYRSSYRVLYDKMYTMNTYKPIVPFNIRITNLKKMKLVGGTNMPHHGGLYLLAVSDSGAAAHPVMQFQGQLFFTDD